MYRLSTVFMAYTILEAVRFGYAIGWDAYSVWIGGN